MSSVRKKRNFKDLHLPSTSISTPSTPPATTNAASTSTIGDRRSASKSSAGTETQDGSSNGLSASHSSNSTRATDPGTGADYHDRLSEKLANFGLGYKLVLKNEDLKVLSELGSGNGGTVTKVGGRRPPLQIACTDKQRYTIVRFYTQKVTRSWRKRLS